MTTDAQEEASKDLSPATNAFSVLMDSARTLVLPEHRGSGESSASGSLRGDWQLHNDLIDLLRARGLGWRFGEEKTSGKAFTDGLAGVLFNICSSKRLSTLKDRGVRVP